MLLLPGVGAQGATPADVARAFTSGPASALVTVSRSVIYAYRGGDADWRTAAGGRGRTAARRGLGGLRLVSDARAAEQLARFAAPAAFLLAATVAVLLVRSALVGRRSAAGARTAAPTTTARRRRPPRRPRRDDRARRRPSST